jgi:hypothetical protein
MNEWIDPLDAPEHPEIPGWYATMHSWDIEEGAFPDGHYWDGENWSYKRCPIYLWSIRPFDTEAEAKKWAYDNDNGW